MDPKIMGWQDGRMAGMFSIKRNEVARIALMTMMNGSGRIVIPKEIREEMRIDYGAFLVIEKENDEAIRLKIVRTVDDNRPSRAPEESNHAPVIQDTQRERLRKFLDNFRQELLKLTEERVKVFFIYL